MTDIVRSNCQNCYWWLPIEGNSGTPENPVFFGECRKRAPYPYPTVREFPKTSHKDWCGDFSWWNPADEMSATYDFKDRELK